MAMPQLFVVKVEDARSVQEPSVLEPKVLPCPTYFLCRKKDEWEELPLPNPIDLFSLFRKVHGTLEDPNHYRITLNGSGNVFGSSVVRPGVRVEMYHV